MATVTKPDWDEAVVRAWLQRRIDAARLDQAAAQRQGRSAEDDCDKATAEEMICTLVAKSDATGDQAAFATALRGLLDREDYAWRGVYDDDRFERHVRSYLRRLVKMTRTNQGFDRTSRYQ